MEKAEIALRYFRNYQLMFSGTKCSEIVDKCFYVIGENTHGRVDTYFEIMMTKIKI